MPVQDAARPLSWQERRDRLRLARSENIGPSTYHHLMGMFGSAAAALAAVPDLARRGGSARPIRVVPASEADAELAACEKAGATVIAFGEAAYPEPLAAIADPPPILSARGHPHLLQRAAVAIVGARNASAAGARFARDIAQELGSRGLIVVSGLARGIDAHAHAGSIESGTVAVLAGGVDQIYPPEHDRLYDRIVAAGAVVSEQPLGMIAHARHFPRRNRIISGLSLAVVVVEAARRSGSLITARMALEQGREVCAVPGFPLDPRHRGTNDLIRKGAVLVESADDVAEAIAGMFDRPLADGSRLATAPVPHHVDSDVLDKGRARVTELLGPTPTPIDEVVRQSELTPGEVLTILVELDLAGRLNRLPGNLVSLIEPDA